MATLGRRPRQRRTRTNHERLPGFPPLALCIKTESNALASAGCGRVGCRYVPTRFSIRPCP
ncbi:MAG: hypothetical protein F6K55_25110 [Moorea sp. SIO4A3]|nr:hypothetical protein [Moorena sp. SIO4A3]